MTTMTFTQTTTAPVVDTQLADLTADLTGFHPVLDRLVSALADVAAADFTAEESMTAVAVLGGLADGSAATLLGLVLRQVANPDTNPALTGLPEAGKRTLRRLGAEYAAAADDDNQRAVAAGAAAVLDGHRS